MFSAGDRVADTERGFGRGRVMCVPRETYHDPYVLEVEFNDPNVGTQWYLASGSFYRSVAPTLRHI